MYCIGIVIWAFSKRESRPSDTTVRLAEIESATEAMLGCPGFSDTVGATQELIQLEIDASARE
jgi:hypothetical protein